MEHDKTFCASGAHLPNGSYVTFGERRQWTWWQHWLCQKQCRLRCPSMRHTGITTAQRPSVSSTHAQHPDFNSPNCQWFDNPAVLSMQKQRWYAGAESLPDGSVVLVGGFRRWWIFNRNFPNIDPEFEGGAAELHLSLPSRGATPAVMQFMIETSGLNSYAHTFLMPSGRCSSRLMSLPVCNCVLSTPSNVLMNL